MNKIQIPLAFKKAPFFANDVVLMYEPNKSFSEVLEQQYFLYEIAVLQGVRLYKPWEEKEYAISAAIKSWNLHKEELAILFRQRKRSVARALMIHFAAYFVSILYWLNNQAVSSLQSLSEECIQLSIKPVNVSERLEFVLAYPDHYHSFIQLVQLYEEIEKLFVKAMLMKNPSR